MLASQVGGWLSLARPGEVLRLRRSDLGLLSDFGCERGPGFVVFNDPKGSWGRDAARAEHVKISDAAGLAFLEACAAPLHEHDLLFPSLACGSASASSARYRKCWDAVYGGALGFPCRDGIGLTPASMRAGALTSLYGAGAEPGRLQWHARHKSERTTRRYVQELGASVVLARLPAARREAIVELARTAPILLRAVTAELRAPPRPSSPVVPRRGPA